MKSMREDVHRLHSKITLCYIRDLSTLRFGICGGPTDAEGQMYVCVFTYIHIHTSTSTGFFKELNKAIIHKVYMKSQRSEKNQDTP